MKKLVQITQSGGGAHIVLFIDPVLRWAWIAYLNADPKNGLSSASVFCASEIEREVINNILTTLTVSDAIKEVYMSEMWILPSYFNKNLRHDDDVIVHNRSLLEELTKLIRGGPKAVA